MKYHKMGDLNIYIGPYAPYFDDPQEPKQKGVNVYYNLQTDFDYKIRRIDHNGQKEQFKVM